jgi:hypothetical protein
MIEAHMNEALIGGPAGSGDAAPGVASLLGLAAAPTFAVLALWTGVFGGQPDMLCSAMGSASPLNGMALMYALMSIFHVAPWLRLLSHGSRGR